MICQKCSHINDDSFNFCEKCANPLIGMQQPSNSMKCSRCGNNNVSIQAVTISKLVDKHHGCLWWLLIGCWWIPFKWLFLTIPALIYKIFVHKGQKIKSKTHSEAVCQNCGNRWRV